MCPVPPFLVGLGAFLFSSASLIFQRASHKHICLKCLESYSGTEVNFMRQQVTVSSLGGLKSSERSETPAAYSGGRPCVQSLCRLGLVLDKLSWFELIADVCIFV